MFGKSVKLFTLFGFEVKIDISWLIIVALISWTLAESFFPSFYENLSTQTYIIMGILGALGLFVSVVLHELSHSLVARRFDLPIEGITLFIFGGVAEMEDEPPSAKAEFFMAIAGPLASVVIGGICLGIHQFAVQTDASPVVRGVLRYVWLINFVLAGFNIVPAFPLDGGRVLRSILWAWKGKLGWATRVASKFGSGFGLALIILGVFNMFGGNIIGGIWWMLIGLFLRNASQMSYKKILIRNNLEGEPVSRFMKRDPVTVSPDISVHELVEDYIYKHHFKMFPVVDENNELVGCVTTKDVKNVDREDWDEKTVQDLSQTCSSNNTIHPNTDVVDALSTMHKSTNSRLMVVDEHGKLRGIIALKDLMDFMNLKVDLEGEGD